MTTEKDIQTGRATDAYFLRTEEALDEAGQNPQVVAEVSADQYPDGENEVFAGLDNAAQLLEGLPVDVHALPEGSYFDGVPVLRIIGNYRDFARFETSLLGYLSHASGIATSADEVKRAVAEENTVLSFGGRHVLPELSDVLERCALLAGFDGVSHVSAADDLPVDPSGTMPHALVLAFGQNNQEEAFNAFNEAVSEDTPRIALCDTFSDEVEEVKKAVDVFGEDLDGVRLDTTSSRRGKFKEIIKEVRWELEQMGRGDVDIFVSGGINPDQICELNDVVDGFGIGSYVSNSDPVDFGLDIVQIEGEPISKRGKLSGPKNVTDTGNPSTTGQIETTDRMVEIIRDGEIVTDFTVEQARTQLESQRQK